jgi:integrin beta 3
VGERGEPGLHGTDGESILGPAGPQGPAGERGEPGLHGKDGAAGLNGHDGRDGKDGSNGTLDNLKVVQSEDHRTVTLCFKDSGAPVEGGVLRFPVVLDRGVFKSETPYVAGDGVTWGGSWWIAQADTTGQKPGDGATAWRLAVKAGRDGKPGHDGVAGPEGKPGPAGRDLTQMDSKGRKW